MKLISLKKTDLIIMIIVLILVVTFIYLRLFSSKSDKILLNYANNRTINIVNSIINQSINDVLIKKSESNYITIQKNDNGDIENLDFNSTKANQILLLVNRRILDDIYLLEQNKLNYNYTLPKDFIYFIPFGIIFNTPVLNNIGPQIPFKIKLTGNSNNDVSISIKEYGINSSLVELLLNIVIEVQVIMPFQTNIINVNKKILLDSKVIQGKIPSYYGGLYYNQIK